MTTTPTSNPIPSEAPQDLKFNAGKIDEFVTSMGWTYTDRLGVKRYTIEGMNHLAQVAISAFGYITLDSFQAGASITLPNQVLRDTSTGEYYRWDGQFQKTVPANSTPSSSGGIGAGAWLSVGDASLRANLGENDGINIVGGSGIFVYIANGNDDGPELLMADSEAALRGSALKIIGVAKITTPTTINSKIFNESKQIFTLDSAVTISNGEAIRPEWFGDVIGAVHAAVNALPTTGGVVKCELNSYKSNGHQYGFSAAGVGITKDNVSILGKKQPMPNSGYTELGGGTVIDGMFAVFANNFYAENIGFGSGKNYVDANFPGGPQQGINEGLFISYLNDEQKNSLQTRSGLHLHNVTGLAYSPTSFVHAIIAGEGYININLTGRVLGCMGYHGVVIKGRDVRAELIEAHCNGGEGVIFKSDSASSTTSDAQVDRIVSRGKGFVGSTPYAVSETGWAVMFQCAGGDIDRVQINEIMSDHNLIGVGVYFTPNDGTSGSVNDITISSITTDSLGMTATSIGVYLASGSNNVSLFSIGNITARNVTQALSYGCSNASISAFIESIHAINISDVIVDAQGLSSLNIGSINQISVAVAAFRLNGSAKVKVGAISGNELAWYATGGYQPSLANGWSQVSGSEAFSVRLESFKVNLTGLVKPGASNIIVTLPDGMKPKSAIRFICNANSPSGNVAVPVTVSADGRVMVNETTNTTDNCSTWLSLSGVSFSV